MLPSRSILGCGAFLAWCLAVAVPTHAQMLVQAAPAQFDVTLRSGQPARRTLFYDNLGKAPVEIRLRLADLWMGPDGELDLRRAGSHPTSLVPAVVLEPTQLVVRPGGRGRVRITLRLPPSGISSRYGVILGEVRPAGNPPSGLSATPAELATPAFVTRVPAESIRADLVQVAARSSRVGTLGVRYRIRSRCDRHLTCSGSIAIADADGRLVQQAAFTPGVVLPRGTRRFSWTSEALAPGRYRVIVTVDAGEPELLVGETVASVGGSSTGVPIASEP